MKNYKKYTKKLSAGLSVIGAACILNGPVATQASKTLKIKIAKNDGKFLFHQMKKNGNLEAWTDDKEYEIKFDKGEEVIGKLSDAIRKEFSLKKETPLNLSLWKDREAKDLVYFHSNFNGGENPFVSCTYNVRISDANENLEKTKITHMLQHQKDKDGNFVFTPLAEILKKQKQDNLYFKKEHIGMYFPINKLHEYSATEKEKEWFKKKYVDAGNVDKLTQKDLFSKYSETASTIDLYRKPEFVAYMIERGSETPNKKYGNRKQYKLGTLKDVLVETVSKGVAKAMNKPDAQINFFKKREDGSFAYIDPKKTKIMPSLGDENYNAPNRVYYEEGKYLVTVKAPWTKEDWFKYRDELQEESCFATNDVSRENLLKLGAEKSKKFSEGSFNFGKLTLDKVLENVKNGGRTVTINLLDCTKRDKIAKKGEVFQSGQVIRKVNIETRYGAKATDVDTKEITIDRGSNDTLTPRIATIREFMRGHLRSKDELQNIDPEKAKFYSKTGAGMVLLDDNKPVPFKADFIPTIVCVSKDHTFEGVINFTYPNGNKSKVSLKVKEGDNGNLLAHLKEKYNYDLIDWEKFEYVDEKGKKIKNFANLKMNFMVDRNITAKKNIKKYAATITYIDKDANKHPVPLKADQNNDFNVLKWLKEKHQKECDSWDKVKFFDGEGKELDKFDTLNLSAIDGKNNITAYGNLKVIVTYQDKTGNKSYITLEVLEKDDCNVIDLFKKENKNLTLEGAEFYGKEDKKLTNFNTYKVADIVDLPIVIKIPSPQDDGTGENTGTTTSEGGNTMLAAGPAEVDDNKDKKELAEDKKTNTGTSAGTKVAVGTGVIAVGTVATLLAFWRVQENKNKKRRVRIR